MVAGSEPCKHPNGGSRSRPAPLIGLGLWHLRKDQRVQLAALAWLLTLGAMTVAFPFAGARGGSFIPVRPCKQSGGALAPVGLERVVQWGRRKRGWNAAQAGTIFRMALIDLAVLLTAVIVWTRVNSGNAGLANLQSSGQAWGQENYAYSLMDKYLVLQGALGGDTVNGCQPARILPGIREPVDRSSGWKYRYLIGSCTAISCDLSGIGGRQCTSGFITSL